MGYSGVSRGHQLQEVIDNGLVVVLEDGSRWELYKGFAERAAAWQPGNLVTVKPGKDPEYPYLLVNVHFNESVECRLLESD